MLKHAFCKNCETGVAVQLKRYTITRDGSLDVLFCPLCGKIMNLDRWQRPAPAPVPEPEASADKPSLLQRLFTAAVNILPGQASFKMNRLMSRLLGYYVATVPFYQCENLVPDFVDSVVNQLVKLSGLEKDKEETAAEFMQRVLGEIGRDGQDPHAANLAQGEK